MRKVKEREAIAKAARTYFDLACALIAPPAPVLIAVGGLSGTGKSVLARVLAPDTLPAPGAVLLRSDVERKMLFGAAETERLPPEAYSAEATEQGLRRACRKGAARHSAAGHSAHRRCGICAGGRTCRRSSVLPHHAACHFAVCS